MTTGPFDDELLNAVLDGTADDATVAAVHADSVASSRLAQLRQVKDLVSVAPASATSERRASSIAAAMAAAQADAPDGVSSIAAARHARDTAAANRRNDNSRRWMAIAAGVALFLVGIPLLLSLRGGDDADFANSSTDDASFAAEGSDDSGDDGDDTAAQDIAESAVDAAADAVDSTSDDDAMADDAMDDSDSAEDVADESGADSSATTTTRQLFEPLPVFELSTIDGAVAAAEIEPIFTYGEIAESGLVELACLEGGYEETDEPQFALIATPDGQTVLIGFGPGGSAEILDAETCSLLG